MTDTNQLRYLANLVGDVQPDKALRARVKDALLSVANDLDTERARVESLSDTVKGQANELRVLRRLRDCALQAEATLQRALGEVKR